MHKIFTLLIALGAGFFVMGGARAVTIKSFLVQKVLDEKVLVTDGVTQYMIEYGYGCYSQDFAAGDYMNVDTYYQPMAYDDIYVETYSGFKTCNITEVDDVDIKVYYLNSEIEDEDKVILIGIDEVPYLVEYGVGCLGMWRYVDEVIYVDVGAGYLDGISDNIYLPNGDDCRVWDAEEIEAAPVYVPSPVITPPTTLTCSQYGLNAYLSSSDNLCYCKSGFQWNTAGDMCVTVIVPTPPPKQEIPSVVSSDEFVESQLLKIVKSNDAMVSRLKGMILLQVEERGAAWYLHPVTLKRYYLKDGFTAYEMLRAFGLGVSELDYRAIENGDQKLKTKLKGRIILRAQAKGEAYYISPKDLSVTYLQNGDAAYQLMRNLSQGISNGDIYQIPAERFVPVK